MTKRCCMLLKKLAAEISGAEPDVAEEKRSGGNLMIKIDGTVGDGKFLHLNFGHPISTISFADYYGFGAALEWLRSEYESRGLFRFQG